MTQQDGNRGAFGSPLVRYGAIGAGIVAVAILAGWCATFAFQDDDDDSPAGGDSTPTAAASPTAATATAVPTRAGSPAASPSPAASLTAATATAGASPSPATTAPATATATRPPATSAPTTAPAATPTATATTAPTNTPTATATPTRAPTATPTATPTTAPITSFAGTWHSAGTCDNPPYYRWTVTLSQQGANVSGTIHFHACPGGGQAAYSVSGTATSADTIELTGPKVVNLGGLGSSTPDPGTFTIAPLGAPSPNYAP